MFDSLNCENVRGDYNLDGEKNDRPNAMADHIHTTPAQWANGFNLPDNFFSAPCLGCVGNLGRNTFLGLSYWAADISLSKTFAFSDKFHLGAGGQPTSSLLAFVSATTSEADIQRW
jgi:hypothetical protein